MENELLFSMTDIEKSFGPVQVLKKANLEVRKGEIHAFRDRICSSRTKSSRGFICG